MLLGTVQALLALDFALPVAGDSDAVSWGPCTVFHQSAQKGLSARREHKPKLLVTPFPPELTECLCSLSFH